MAKQIEGVYEEVIDVAKNEFLENGFKNASLRTIALKANTTTGSIYTRFGDKAGLFSAIVEPVATELLDMFCKIQEKFHSFEPQVQKEQAGKYTSNSVDDMLEYMYANLDRLKLLLLSAQGTKFEFFVDQFIDIEVEYTYKYMDVVGCESIKSGHVTEDFVHIITTAYFQSFFEVIRHNMSKEDAKRYIKMLGKYHLAGFDTIFNPQNY